MLEGTKHEKVVLVILAYVIGLTSGFIGFGVNNYHKNSFDNKDLNSAVDSKYVESPVLGTSDKAGYMPPEENPPEGVLNDADSEDLVLYEDGHLTAVTKEGHMVLSVHINKLGENIPETLAKQGHHIEPPVFVPSPEGRYIYFCEQHLGSDNCLNLLFDAEAVTIQYVKVDDSTLVTPASQAASAYWAVDGLHVGEYISESLQTPWKLVKNNLNELVQE